MLRRKYYAMRGSPSTNTINAAANRPSSSNYIRKLKSLSQPKSEIKLCYPSEANDFTILKRKQNLQCEQIQQTNNIDKEQIHNNNNCTNNNSHQVITSNEYIQKLTGGVCVSDGTKRCTSKTSHCS